MLGPSVYFSCMPSFFFSTREEKMSFFRRCFNLPLHTPTHKKKLQRQEQLVENVEGAQIRVGHWKRRWQEKFCASRKNGFGSTLKKKKKKSFYYFRCRLAWSKNGELLYKCWFCPFQEKSSLFRSDWSIEWSLPSDTGVWGWISQAL